MEYSEYTKIHDKIRYREVKYVDPMIGDDCLDYSFEVFKRPYFWGLIGKKRWEEIIQTNSFEMGLGFSQTFVK